MPSGSATRRSSPRSPCRRARTPAGSVSTPRSSTRRCTPSRCTRPARRPGRRCRSPGPACGCTPPEPPRSVPGCRSRRPAAWRSPSPTRPAPRSPTWRPCCCARCPPRAPPRPPVRHATRSTPSTGRPSRRERRRPGSGGPPSATRPACPAPGSTPCATTAWPRSSRRNRCPTWCACRWTADPRARWPRPSPTVPARCSTCCGPGWPRSASRPRGWSSSPTAPSPRPATTRSRTCATPRSGDWPGRRSRRTPTG